ncbi:MAG: glucose/arabinose dehydrogenase, partial [Planctomycetota bacterium]
MNRISTLGLALVSLGSLASGAALQSEAGGIQLERVFPRLRFDRPVHVTGAGDGSGRLFVVEQSGVVRVVGPGADPSTADVFLDITERVSRAGNEEGLIGFAFHPKFSENGEVYVHYSLAGPDATGILSRFTLMKDDPSRLNPESEHILLRQPQPYRNHNGGTVAFGPEGYLFLTLGDGGAADDPHGNGQNLLTLLGSILRIDVDTPGDGLPYGIPEDNPFAGDPESARAEIYAFGFRNVWRFSFDRETGELWAGDVGQNLIEEIDVVEYAGNYGWRRFEATRVFDKTTELTTEPAIGPVSTYGRTEGISITGGNVYRGQRYPSLQGAYFYGDYASGNIWRVLPSDDGYRTDLVCRSGRSIAAFGEDDEGEL